MLIAAVSKALDRSSAIWSVLALDVRCKSFPITRPVKRSASQYLLNFPSALRGFAISLAPPTFALAVFKRVVGYYIDVPWSKDESTKILRSLKFAHRITSRIVLERVLLFTLNFEPRGKTISF